MNQGTAVVGMLLLVMLTSVWVSAQEFRGDPQRGQAVYERNCLRCHGPSGDGTGPDATTLIVPPANFHLPQHRLRTDRELYMAVSEGVLFSPMHGWRGRLTEQDMQDVINYIRTLVPFLPLS